MSFLYRLFFGRSRTSPPRIDITTPIPKTAQSITDRQASTAPNVKRHFFNGRGFQTYGSFFPLWNGYITAAHVIDAAGDQAPPFAVGEINNWVGGLDAALIGCQISRMPPPPPRAGQSARCIGYPAGSNTAAVRQARIYIERPGQNHVWIARITTPDEPVVTGMSGGMVLNQDDQPIGILITRNSPADLNNDRDPDESFDFVSLSGVWHAMKQLEDKRLALSESNDPKV